MSAPPPLDAFSVAGELFGDLPLTTEQPAQLRALNHRYWQAVFDLLHGRAEDRHVRSAPATAAPVLTPAQHADLRAMLERALREMATEEQRIALGWDRRRAGRRVPRPGGLSLAPALRS